MKTKTYEIWDLTTGEILVDNLDFDDVPELFDAYAKFYPFDDIVVCCREVSITVIRERMVKREPNRRVRFYNEWFNFIDELLAIDNIH